jgi:Ca2+-binding EF-hand superfamily protein
LLDKDGDGNISNYEIRSLMNSLGYSPSEEDISSVIAKIDIDGQYILSQNFINKILFIR